MTTTAPAETPPRQEVTNLIARLTRDPAVTPRSQPTQRVMRSARHSRRGNIGKQTRIPRQRQLDELWAMSPANRVAAMWRGELTLFQLTRWSSRAPHEVPLLGGEFAYIAMRTPEWADE